MATNPEEEARRLIDEQNAQLSSTANSLSDSWKRESQKLGSASNDLAGSMSSASQDVNSASLGLSQLGSSAVQFTRALTNGEDGLSKYSGSVSAAGDGLSSLLMALGPVGVVLGAFTKLFTATVEQVLKYDDNLIKGYDQLSELGGAAQFTTESLAKLAKDADYVSVNGQSLKLVKIIGDLGPNLIALGSSSAEGMKKFGEIASFGNKSIKEQQVIRNQFNNIGISQEKLTKYQADYVKQQGMLNLTRAKEPKQLSDESLKYVTNLSALSALTGETTEALANNRKKDLENFGFNIMLRDLGTSETADKQRELFQNVKDVLRSNVSGPAAKAFMDAMASPNKMSDEVIQMLGQTQGQFTSWVQDFKKGNLTGEGLINKLNQSGNETLKRMGEALKANPELARQMGINAETLANSGKTMAEGQIEAQKKAAENAKNRIDPYKELQNKSNNAASTLNQAFDSFIKLISGPVNSGFQTLLKAFKVLVTGFLKKFGDDLGLPPELPYMFDSTEELAEQQAELTKKLAKLSSETDVAKQVDAEAALRGGEVSNVTEMHYEEIDKVNSQLLGIDKARRLRDGENYKKVEENTKKQEQRAKVENAAAARSSYAQSDPRLAPNALSQAQEENTKVTPAGPTASESSPAPATPTEAPKKMSQGGRVDKTFSTGGILDGPASGYKTSMSSNKDYAVVPLPNGDNIPVSFISNNRNSLLSNTDGVSSLRNSYSDNLSKSTQSMGMASTSTDMNSSAKMASIALESISYKLNTLLGVIKENNGLQKEMLHHVKS